MNLIDSTLKMFTRQFNETRIFWGVGGSVLLKHYGITKHVNDIDLLIAADDAIHAKEIIEKLGKGGQGVSKEPFHSEFFYQYSINDTDVDLISRFRIQHEKGMYELQLDSSSITGYITVEHIQIPLTALEDWFVLYQLFHAKKEKADHIESYFREKGIQYPHLLERALLEPLPYSVSNRINKLLVL